MNARTEVHVAAERPQVDVKTHTGLRTVLRMPRPDQYVQLADAAALLKVHPNTLRKAVRRNRLGPIKRVGARTIMVRWADAQRYRATSYQTRSDSQRERRERERQEMFALRGSPRTRRSLYGKAGARAKPLSDSQAQLAAELKKMAARQMAWQQAVVAGHLPHDDPFAALAPTTEPALTGVGA